MASGVLVRYWQGEIACTKSPMQPHSKPATETQVSAGGAVLRKTSGGLDVALISVGNPPRWQLPKGSIDAGETPEAAAVREVREEAGIDATPSGLIEKVEYWYQSKRGNERIRYHKFVNFFLMWYDSGDVAHHDSEVNEARWFPVAEAVQALAFRSERTIVQRAVELADR
jgi:8-oxo-dGTP pyrophosphatase MutT (NUDIX family)